MSTAAWPGDDLSLVVWASAGGTDLEIDEEPEQVIDRLRANGYTLTTAAAEIGLNPGQRRELLTAAAWSGIARVALRRRDDAIRDCVSRGAPYREVAQATGLSHTAIGRVIERTGSDRGRW